MVGDLRYHFHVCIGDTLCCVCNEARDVDEGRMRARLFTCRANSSSPINKSEQSLVLIHLVEYYQELCLVMAESPDE